MSNDEKGKTVNSDERPAKTASPRTGIFAAPHAFSGARGNSAPSALRNRCGATSLAILCTSLLAFILTAAPASAGIVHPFKSQITGTPPTGPFSSPEGVTVDPVSQDVYVADRQGQVDIFNSAGVYQSQITGMSLPVGDAFSPTSVAVSDKTGDVYVASTGFVYVFNALGGYEATITEGAPGKSLGSVAGIAVDNSMDPSDSDKGDVYVADQVVDRFNSNNKYQSQLTTLAQPNGVAVDSSGDVYVAETETESASAGITEFNSKEEQILHITGAPSGSFPFRQLEGAAVDSAGNIYVTAQFGHDSVVEFDSSGAFVSETHTFVTSSTAPTGAFGRASGVAVNAAGDVYISDHERGAVDVFGLSVLVPGVGGELATSVSDAAASLHGTVNPEGTEVGSCEFEYRTAAEPEYGHHSIECSPKPPYTGTANMPVEAALGGLAANTTYYYRLVASNAKGGTGGAGYGPEESLETLGAPRVEGLSAEVNPAAKAGQTSATLKAQVDPDGPATTYTFEYGETESYGTSVPSPPAAVGSGEAFVAVTAELTGLKVGTTYHYRVSASNEFGTVPSPDQTFSTLPAVLIESESVLDVAATGATLEAQIDPLGAGATCVFQYVSDANFHSSAYAAAVSVPCPAALGEGETGVLTSVHVQGLTAGTSYHYRVVATSFGVVEGADRVFTTQRSGESLGVGGLPDDRQWELVSPPDKHGATLEGFAPAGTATQASEDGGAITYAVNAPTEANPPGNVSPESVQVFSARGGGTLPGGTQSSGAGSSSSWSSRDIGTPHDAPTLENQTGHESEYKLFSGDLSFGLVEPVGETPLSPGASQRPPYLRDDAGGTYTPLVYPGNVPAGTNLGSSGSSERTVGFVGATPDFSHVVLESKVALVEGDSAGLYEWAAGRLQPVSVLPDGKPSASSPFLGDSNRSARHAISNDGSRVVWEAAGNLYMRDMVREETLQIGGNGATFEDANAEGSRVFFSGQVCEVKISKSNKLECLVTSLGGPVLGASEDGSYVYLVGGGVLTESENGQKEKAVLGDNNLYVLHDDGAEWTATFITRLSSEDSDDWSPPNLELNRLTSRVSPDGRWLAFMSDSSLTGYNNEDVTSGHVGERLDEEVYLYDAGANRLVCASCDPTGARPTGIFDTGVPPLRLVDSAQVWKGRWLAGLIPGWTPSSADNGLYQSRYLSDGGRLFFDSSDALVPQDTDGTEDVYEYEPAVGAGGGPGGIQLSSAQAPPNDSCATGSSTYSARSEGCIGLISSGTSGEESAFLDASENGDDVFFLTASKLVSQDTEASLSLFDAHVCGAEGVPCPPPPPAVPPACTNSDSCRAAPSPQPSIFGSAASATFSGVGNITPEVAPPPKKVTKKTVKCKRGFVKNKKNNCVKRSKTKKRAKKSAHINRRTK
jgi:sugar lactone lactonase YvrE